VKGNSLKGEVAEKLVLTFYKLPQTVDEMDADKTQKMQIED